MRVAGLEAEQFHPRTAVGLVQNGRSLILAVVDGREFSEGMNFPELADLMLSFIEYTAMSLDGVAPPRWLLKAATVHRAY